MNEVLSVNAMQEYKASLRRKQIHQGLVIGVESHAPHGKKMQCAIIQLNNGLRGMIYEDQFDRHKYRSLVGFIDHKVDFMVLDVQRLGLDPKTIKIFDEEKGLVLLSRVHALEELQEEFWETVDLHHVCTGVVNGFENERIYLMIKGVTCVLPIQDYEYDWTQSGRNLIPLGTELTVKVTKLDRDKKQVRVSRKELLEDPWQRVRDYFKIDDFYPGVVTSVVENTGVFVKLKPGIESLSWFPQKLPKGIQNYPELVGKTVSVRIKHIEQNGKRIRSKIITFPHELF